MKQAVTEDQHSVLKCIIQKLPLTSSSEKLFIEVSAKDRLIDVSSACFMYNLTFKFFE